MSIFSPLMLAFVDVHILAAMTSGLGRCAGSGLIARVAEPTDRRSSAAELAGEGRRLVGKAIALRFQGASDALAVLSEIERVRLAVLLKKSGRELEDVAP